MLKSKICFLFCLISFASVAQIAISVDPVGGTPVTGEAYAEIKGSPYLYDDFVKGDVNLVNGKKYQDMELKYDAVAKKLIFLEKGTSNYFKDPVKSFTLKSPLGIQHFEAITEGGFVERLSEGATPLWKQTLKGMVEDRPYGSTKVQKIINTTNVYYSGKLTALAKLKTDKKSLLALFPEKAQALEAFLKSNKLNLKSEQDLISVFNFMNSSL